MLDVNVRALKQIMAKYRPFNCWWLKIFDRHWTIKSFWMMIKKIWSSKVGSPKPFLVVNNFYFFIIGDYIFRHLWSPHVKLDECFWKPYYTPLFQIESPIIQKFRLWEWVNETFQLPTITTKSWWVKISGIAKKHLGINKNFLGIEKIIFNYYLMTFFDKMIWIFR
jgi:hypothetical protein